MRNTSPITATVIDGGLRITLKKRASARQEVEASIDGNGLTSALNEILSHYTYNGTFIPVDSRYSCVAGRGLALAHPDDYVVDNYGNLVYLRHVYVCDTLSPHPLEVLLEQGYVDFTSNTLDEMKSRVWINLRLALYNRVYSTEFVKDVVCASECRDGYMLIELLPDGTSRGFWSTNLHEPHSQPGSAYIVVNPISSNVYEWILNSDIVAESDRPTWGNYEEYSGLRENANKILREHRLTVACAQIRDGIIAIFNAVEAHETESVE